MVAAAADMKMKLALFILVCFAAVQSGDAEGKSLVIKIVVDYRPPVTFTLAPPSYRAATPLTLSCQIENVDETAVFHYEWSSTCTGRCFVGGSIDANVSTPFLHSYDSGVHTCTVYDDLGCVGSVNTTVNVVGAGIFVQSEALPNNSFIIASSRGTIPIFRCLSGSSSPYVGQLIDNYGRDITNSSDLFSITHGGPRDPGTMLVRSLRLFTESDVGMYTYRVPDENGNVVYFHFGLYLRYREISTSSLSYLLYEDSLKIHFVSKYSPPTQVIWEREGEKINISTEVQFYQALWDWERFWSYYDIYLEVIGSIENTIAEYSYTVINRLGRSRGSTTVAVFSISGHESPLLVGITRRMHCYSYIQTTEKMEWLLESQEQALQVRKDGGNQLTLFLSQNDTSLDGVNLTCRVTTSKNSTYEETITLEVVEPVHYIEIEAPSNNSFAGEKYSLSCVVVSDFPSSVKWLGPDDDEVAVSDTLKTSLSAGGNTTKLILTFDPLKASHEGVYTCVSVIESVLKTSETREVFVEIPFSVDVTRLPSTGTLYTLDTLTLTCTTTLPHNPAVDLPLLVSHEWMRLNKTINSSTVVVSNNTLWGEVSPGVFTSTLNFSSLLSSDSGDYFCISTVQSLLSYEVDGPSTKQIASIEVNIALRVTIEINYTSPDVYPVYSPPNYRVASGPVTLKCVAAGITSNVTYQWTSTCKSCFAHNSLSQSVEKTVFLVSDDAGVHSCTVRDENGNTGTANTTMNIVGAGISSDKAHPSNSYFFPYYYDDWYSCCCDTGINTSKSWTFPDDRILHNYYYYGVDIQDYYRCLCLLFYYVDLSGVYTCNIVASEGTNSSINIGIYDRYSYEGLLTINQIEYKVQSNGSLFMVCQTRDAPPTTINWYREGVLLDTYRGPGLDMDVAVTHRSNSSFEIMLEICKENLLIDGEYTLEVSGLGNDTTSITVHGLQISCMDENFTVGARILCNCSGVVELSSVHHYSWYNVSQRTTGTSPPSGIEDENAISLQNRSGSFHLLNRTSGPEILSLPPLSTDDEGSSYTCSVSTTCGVYTSSITIHPTVPNSWATVQIISSSANPMEDSDYSLQCTVRVIPGMNLPVRMEWVGPDGTVVRSEGNRTVGEVETQGTHSTLTLSFQPVFSSDAGRYACRAAITVPWMARQPPQKLAPINVNITSQDMFQLTIYPVPQCLNLDVEKAHELSRCIKASLGKAVRSRCACNFNSSALISSEHFSCQTVGNVLATHLTYRALLSGSTDLLPTSTALEHIQDWMDTEGAFDFYYFRLKLVSSRQCKLKIEALDEKACQWV